MASTKHQQEWILITKVIEWMFSTSHTPPVQGNNFAHGGREEIHRLHFTDNHTEIPQSLFLELSNPLK